MAKAMIGSNEVTKCYLGGNDVSSSFLGSIEVCEYGGVVSLPFTITSVAGDNHITEQEFGDGYDVVGTGDPGATVTLKSNPHNYMPTLSFGGSTIVGANGIWIFPISRDNSLPHSNTSSTIEGTQTPLVGGLSYYDMDITRW